MNEQHSVNPENPSFWVPTQFHRDGMSTLWLPSHYSATPDLGDLDMMRVYARFSDLFQQQVGWSDVLDRLSRYSLSRVLDVTSRVSTTLRRYEPHNTLEGQKFLCHGLFGARATAVWRALESWRQSLPQDQPLAEVMLFHELQVVNTVKIAILAMNPSEPSRAGTLDGLGEAMLIVNDLIGHGDDAAVASADINTEAGRRLWHQHFVTNGLFHHGENESHALARAYDLYLTDRPHLRDCGAYIDLPDAVLRLTGLGPDLLWTIMFALYGHWRTMQPEGIDTAVGAVNYRRYFSQYCNFTESESTQFFSLVSQSVATTRDRLVDRGCREGQLKPYDCLPFEDRPFIQVDDHVYCSSTRLAFRKLTRGLHHLFLNRMSDDSERALYLTYMGEVFDDYVRQLMRRIFPDVTNRYIDGTALKEPLPSGAKSCDGVVVYPDTLLLIEAKATLFPLDVRVTGSWESYVSKVRDIFGNGAEQIDSTIRHVQGGLYESLGIDPHRTMSYVPIIVTLEDLPLNPMLFELVDNELEQRGCLRGSAIRPLQAVDVADLEFVEVASESGVNLSELFVSKSSDPATRARPLGNYAMQRDETFIRSSNAHLRSLFEQIAEQALASVRARARDKPI